MPDLVAELVRIEVRLAELARADAGRVLSAPPEGHPEATIWCDYGFKWPAYTFAHLHRFEHPENPHHGEGWCLDLAAGLLEKCTETWRWRRGRGLEVASREVPHYLAAALIEWLGERLPEHTRAGCIEHAEAWAAQALVRPFGFTGNYHDAWRLLALYRLGRALDRAEWREAAAGFFRRMIALQEPAGFWQERRGHGPSMRYNGLMLPALAWMYRLTGEELFRDSAARLASFMAAYSYPDAITVGPFDGRNAPMMAFFPTCAGLELVPEGRALAARALGLWRDLGAPRRPELLVDSSRDAVRVAFYAADTCAYLAEHVPAAERAAAADESGKLPVEVRGTVESHGAAFDGLLHGSGPWVLALSGQNSDVPRTTRNVYRLERQSRIELWHRRARLTLGGGHSLREAPVPYCNAVLDTGYAGPSDFGRLDLALSGGMQAARWQPGSGGAEKRAGEDRGGYSLSQSYFTPELARVFLEGSSPLLELVFAHGLVRWRFSLTEAGCGLAAGWEVQHLERLALQVPVVVWAGAGLLLDGAEAPAGGAPAEVREEVRVEGGPFGARYALAVPPGVPCRVHWPLAAQPSHARFFEGDRFRPAFRIALVSCQWERPAPTGAARFTLAVE